MSDPFRPEASQQLMREARIGLTLLAITLATFVYVAYYRISGSGVRLPEYVVNAPIAEAVWPGENPLALVEKKQAPQTLGPQFGSLLENARNTFGIDQEKSSTNKLLSQSRDYVDPTPRKDTSPMPEAKVPVREPVNNRALTEFHRDPHVLMEKNSSIPPITRSTPQESPLDANELRATRTIAKTAFDTESKLTREPNRPPQQQISTRPVIVTPAKVADSEFAPITLRPICESTTTELNKTNVLATPDKFANEFLSQTPESEKSVQQATDDNSFSHEGSRISSQIVTSDIAANLLRQPQESFAEQRQPEKQTVFDREPELPQEFADEPEIVSESNGRSVDSPSTSVTVEEDKTGNSDEHLVLAGESFWSIAQQHYDDGRFFRALFEYNKQRVGSFENLPPGSTLATPPKTELAKLWPELCPGADDSSPVSTNIKERIYVTQQGDTLFEIARQRLEQASRYLEIQKLNEFRLPDGVNHLSPLPAGIQLVLPLDVAH